MILKLKGIAVNDAGINGNLKGNKNQEYVLIANRLIGIDHAKRTSNKNLHDLYILHNCAAGGI